MSASSSTSNTGPNRFRGDAASFSPSQPPNYQPYQSHQSQQQSHQQFLQQQSHQQQMYMQYGPQYPMMMNHQMVYPPVFMPMYSQDVFYQGQPYIMPQVPFSPNNIPGHMNMGYNTRNKNKVKRNSQMYNNQKGSTSLYVQYSPNNSSPLLKSDTPTQNEIQPSQQTPQSTPESNIPASVSIPPQSSTPKQATSDPSSSPSHSPSNQTATKNDQLRNLNDTHEPSNDKIDTKTDTIAPNMSTTASKHTSIPPVKTEDTKPTFPFFLNSSLEEYTASKSQTSTKRKELFRAKYNRLIGSKTSNSLLIKSRIVQVVDHNTDTIRYVNNKSFAPKEFIEKDLLSTSNWASILQSTPMKKVVKKPQVTSTQTSLQTSTPSSIQPSIPLNGSFNIQNESIQPLGILLLRIMFDGNYSVLNTHKKLPLFKIQPRGLSNTGNICYMNSILQVLLYCEPFNRLLKLIEDKSIGSLSKVSPTPLLDATIKFFNEFVNVEDKKSISPENFYMNLINHKKFQHLKWGQQEDAEEFLGYYLDGLNEEFLDAIRKLNTPSVDSLIQTFSSEQDGEVVNQFKYDVKNTIRIIKNDGEANKEDEEWNEVGSSKKISVRRAVEIEPTPITMIFGGQFKSVLTIPKSPTSNVYQKSITVDPFQHVQLDISEAESIEEAIEHINSHEKISYKMNNNSKEIQIKKQTFIDKLPRVLIIHLKRFSFLKDQDMGIEKLRKKVAYGHTLHIPSEVLSNKSGQDDDNEYKLVGVVYHHGNSAQGGHYTSDVLRNKDDDDENSSEWIRIDDTSLKVIKPAEVINGGSEENIKNAYILMYERSA